MTAHEFWDKAGYRWVVGYDEHRGGYYANREESVFIGRWEGVTLTHLKFRMANYGSELPMSLIMQLEKDKARCETWLGRLLLRLGRK